MPSRTYFQTGKQAVKTQTQKKTQENLLVDFAQQLADECSPSEAAFRSGAKREDGHKLLEKLRRKVGIRQCV